MFDYWMVCQIGIFVSEQYVVVEIVVVVVYCEYGVSCLVVVVFFVEVYLLVFLIVCEFVYDVNYWVVDQLLCYYFDLYIEILLVIEVEECWSLFCVFLIFLENGENIVGV